MRTKQFVATLPESAQGVGTRQTIEVADPPAPVDQVQVGLGLSFGQCSRGLGQRAQPRSTDCAAGSGVGAGAATLEELLSTGAPCDVPFVGE